MENQLITYYCIVRLQWRYGAWYFNCLVLHGWCRLGWRIIWEVGGDNRVTIQFCKFGEWFLCVLCWCLWRERNVQSFEDRELGLIELKKTVLQTLVESNVAFVASINTCWILRFMYFILSLKAFVYLSPMVYVLCTWIVSLCAYLWIDITYQKIYIFIRLMTTQEWPNFLTRM